MKHQRMYNTHIQHNLNGMPSLPSIYFQHHQGFQMSINNRIRSQQQKKTHTHTLNRGINKRPTSSMALNDKELLKQQQEGG